MADLVAGDRDAHHKYRCLHAVTDFYWKGFRFAINTNPAGERVAMEAFCMIEAHKGWGWGPGSRDLHLRALDKPKENHAPISNDAPEHEIMQNQIPLPPRSKPLVRNQAPAAS